MPHYRLFQTYFAALIASLFFTAALSADCNGNGVDDLVDIQIGTSKDCDGSLVPDECELVLTQPAFFTHSFPHQDCLQGITPAWIGTATSRTII